MSARDDRPHIEVGDVVYLPNCPSIRYRVVWRAERWATFERLTADGRRDWRYERFASRLMSWSKEQPR